MYSLRINLLAAMLVSLQAAFAISGATPKVNGRWCTVISAVTPEQVSAAQGAQCDGFADFGNIHNLATIKTVSVLIPRSGKNKERRVTVPNPGLWGQDIARATTGKPDAVKKVVERYLKENNLPALGDATFTVDSVELEPEDHIYADHDGRERLQPDPTLLDDNFKIDPTRPFSREMACLSRLKKFSGLDPNIMFDRGDKTHQPLMVLQAVPRGVGRADLIFTPDGYYATPYTALNSDRRGRHYVQVPGSKDHPAPRWVYHEFNEKSGPNALPSYTEPFASNKALDDVGGLQPEALDAAGMHKDDKNPLRAELYKKLLSGTRKFRDIFDNGNPRFRSDFTRRIVSNAIETCRKVEGLQPEISFFENHVFPERNPHTHVHVDPMLAAPLFPTHLGR